MNLFKKIKLWFQKKKKKNSPPPKASVSQPIHKIEIITPAMAEQFELNKENYDGGYMP